MKKMLDGKVLLLGIEQKITNAIQQHIRSEIREEKYRILKAIKK